MRGYEKVVLAEEVWNLISKRCFEILRVSLHETLRLSAPTRECRDVYAFRLFAF